VGARLDMHIFAKSSTIMIILGYLFARSIGKISGAMAGGFISKAKKSVTLYTGICLFTQGGVAMGLAMSISHNLSVLGQRGEHMGTIIMSVVAATTVVVQLLGPVLVKLGINKADEAYRNITEGDIIESHNVEDFMQKDFSFIKEDATLDKILNTVKERESYHFPVIDSNGELVGLISLGGLRDVFFEEQQLNNIVLAKDIAEPAGRVLYKGQPLKEAFEIFDRREVDYLPVVESKESRKVAGILEYHPLVEAVNRKLLERHQSLERATDKVLSA
jgi:CBS domain-containing protein